MGEDVLTDLCAQAAVKESEGSRLHFQKKVEEAFEAFDEAGRLYRDAGEPLKAAVCFASAATCWNIHTGWQPLRKSATRNHAAAVEAMKGKNFDYAAALYREAAMQYEKEGDAENYSECYVAAKRASASRYWETFVHARVPGAMVTVRCTMKDRLHALKRWLLNEVSYRIWGYGEHPGRTLFAALLLIFAHSLIYSFSGLVYTADGLRKVGFMEALYFSFITFCTVGYGDYLPTGYIRIFSVIESMAGITLPSLFLITLSRRYLRMDRS